MFLKMLIRQQMKTLKMSYADIAVKTGIPFKTVRDYVDYMEQYEVFVKMEKIMLALDLFTFEDEAIDKTVKKEFKKIDKNKFIY